MNAPEKMLAAIQSKLNKLWDAVRDLGKFQQYDIDRNTDRFFCGLLNMITDWNLVITNPKDDAAECVQLIDVNARRAVSITPSVTIKKLKHSLFIFHDYALESRFSRLLFISFTSIPSSRIEPLRCVAREISSPNSIVIWDKKGIMHQIETLPSDRLPMILKYLDENHLVPPPRPEHILPMLPPASTYFIFGSRDRELTELGQMLKKREPIFIWGLGGIGKTQTVIQLAKLHRPPKGAYLISCIRPKDNSQEFLKETILAAFNHSSLPEEYDDLSRTTSTIDLDAAYKEKLEILRKEYAGAMLIIDNLDCPGKTLAEIQAEQAYRDLCALDLQLIFTTRSPVTGSNSIRIDPLQEDMLTDLMCDIMHSAQFSEAELRELIRAVKGHTLMVVLMARTLAEGSGNVTPGILLDALRNSTLNRDDFPTIEWDRNEEYSQAQIYTHLCALFNVSDLKIWEKAVMRYASLLPENGMEYNLFLECLPSKYMTSAGCLVDSGWLQKDEFSNQLSVHPVIREVSRIELKPTDDSCRLFLQRLWNQCNLTASFQKEKIVQIARCFSIASDKLADQNGEWACWAGRCWSALGRHKLALRYNQQMLDLLLKNPSCSRQNLSTAYSHVGSTYQEMGNYHEALKHLKKALEIRETELSVYDPQLASAYNNIGNIYGEQKDFPEALKYHQKALEISIMHLPPYHPELGRSYTNVGITYVSMQNYQQALDCYLKALEILEKVHPSGHPDLAQLYNYVGSTYEALNELGKAMSYKLKALRIFDLVLPEDHPELARVYNSMGSTYSKLGEYSDALKYVQKAVAVRERTLQPDHPDLAISYETLADIYNRMRNYRKALEFATKATEVREKILPKNHPALALSYKNVGLTYVGLQNISGAHQYLQRALEILRSNQKDGQENMDQTIFGIRHVLSMLPSVADPSNSDSESSET